MGKYLQISRQMDIALKTPLLLICCATFIITLLVKGSHVSNCDNCLALPWPLFVLVMTRTTLLCHHTACFHFQTGSRWAWCFPGEETLSNSFCWLQYPLPSGLPEREGDNFHAWDSISSEARKYLASAELLNALFNKYCFVNT